MARILQDLLEVDHYVLDDSIDRLEAASGHASRDVRLAAEITGKKQFALKSLGLDPQDSHGREVYAALLDLARQHDTFLQRQLHLSSSTSPEDVLVRIHAFVCKLNLPRSVWVLKPHVVKKILKDIPPKRTKKALGYRSLDSMLKREPVPHILAAARHIESDSWQDKLMKRYEEVSANDFEQRQIEICLPNTRYWRELGLTIASELQTNVVDVKELGAILLLPLPKRAWSGVSLALVTLLLTHVEELRMYSSMFKLHQMQDDFSRRFCTVLRTQSRLHHHVIDKSVDWKIVHAYYSSVDEAEHPEFFKPHVTLDDLAWRKIEHILLSIEPAFDFWEGNEYVGGFFDGDDRPVSFNMMDAVLNLVNNVPFEKRMTHMMQSSLWDEILLRYMQSNYVRSRVLQQLGQGAIPLQNAMDKGAFTLS